MGREESEESSWWPCGEHGGFISLYLISCRESDSPGALCYVRVCWVRQAVSEKVRSQEARVSQWKVSER